MQIEKKVVNEVFYGRNFSKNLNPAVSERLRTVSRVFSTTHFHRLLDIGCGDGSFSSVLKNFCDEIYGADIADEAIDLSIERGVKAVKVNVDVEDLPFGNNFFEAVYCGDLIEHLYDPDHLLDEIQRVLAPGGICVITTPNLASWLNRLVLLLGFQPFNTEVSLRRNVGKFRAKEDEVSGHLRVFTYRSLKELLYWHCFRIKEIIGIGSSKNLPLLAKQIDRILSKKASLSSFLVVVLRKELAPTDGQIGLSDI